MDPVTIALLAVFVLAFKRNQQVVQQVMDSAPPQSPVAQGPVSPAAAQGEPDLLGIAQQVGAVVAGDSTGAGIAAGAGTLAVLAGASTGVAAAGVVGVAVGYRVGEELNGQTGALIGAANTGVGTAANIGIAAGRELNTQLGGNAAQGTALQIGGGTLGVGAAIAGLGTALANAFPVVAIAFGIGSLFGDDKEEKYGQKGAERDMLNLVNNKTLNVTDHLYRVNGLATIESKPPFTGRSVMGIKFPRTILKPDADPVKVKACQDAALAFSRAWAREANKLSFENWKNEKGMFDSWLSNQNEGSRRGEFVGRAIRKGEDRRDNIYLEETLTAGWMTPEFSFIQEDAQAAVNVGAFRTWMSDRGSFHSDLSWCNKGAKEGKFKGDCKRDGPDGQAPVELEFPAGSGKRYGK